MTTDDIDARFRQYDETLADLARRLKRVEGELGIVDVDEAGVPNRSEILPPQQPTAAPN